MATDYYSVLGVRRDATGDEIKKAYRKLARELHPDVNDSPDAQERIKEVNAAYEVLSDPEKRQMFDLGADPLGPGGGNGGANPFAGFGGLGDIMDAFFGGAAQRGGPRSRVRQGGDSLARLQLDLEEAAFGVSKDVTVTTAVLCQTCTGTGCAEGSRPVTCTVCGGSGEIQSVQRSFLGQMVTSRPCSSCGGTGQRITNPCPECSGEGRVRSRRTIPVKVPAGVDDGMRLRLAGEGEIGPGGGPAGDLYVEISVKPHPVFTRDGDDLHCTARISMAAAALGTFATLTTLDGEERLEFPPGTQGGSALVLKARGVPHVNSAGRGNIVVHVEVVTPVKPTPEERALLEKLAALGEGDPVEIAGADSGSGHGFFSRLKGAFSKQ